MSAEADADRRDPSSSRSEESSGSRINPTNWPDHLRQYSPSRPDDPGAREVQDPHSWDDPDPGPLERVTPDTTAGWLVAWALGLITLGVAAYLLPIFAGALLDPIVLAATVLGGLVITAYVKGRIDGIETLRDVDKSIIYYGDDVDVRLGRRKDDSGPEPLFTPLRDFSLAGFKVRYLLKRDLPYKPEKLRSYPGEDVGNEEAADALNKTTAEVDTETLGKVLVTHASDLDYAGQSTDADRHTPLPERFDEDVAEDVQILIRRLRRQIKTLQADAEELERAAEDARDLRNKQLAPELEKSLIMLDALQSTVNNDDDRRKRNGKNDSAGLEAVVEAAEKAKNGR